MQKTKACCFRRQFDGLNNRRDESPGNDRVNVNIFVNDIAGTIISIATSREDIIIF